MIGAYWRAHHRFWSKLRSVSPGLIVVNLVFLAAIAFTPFPTALAGRSTDDAITVASTIPVVVFLVSVPVALLATTHAMVVWLLIIRLEFAADRRLRPAAIDGAR